MLGSLPDHSKSMDYRDRQLHDSQTDAILHKQNAETQEKKKQQGTQETPKFEEARPASLVMTEGRVKPRDLLERFQDQMAERGLGGSETMAADIESKLESFFSSGAMSGLTANDSAVLSMVAQQSHSEEMKPKSAKNEQFWNDVIYDPEVKQKKQAADPALQNLRGASTLTIPEEIQKTARDLVKRYLVAFSGSMMTDSPKKKEEASRLREKLVAMDFPVGELKTAEKNIQKMMVQDIRAKAKEAIIQLALTYTNRKSLDSFQQGETFLKIQALGKKVGVFDSDEAVNDVNKDGLEETRAVLSSELDELTVKRGMEGNLRALIKDFSSLNGISNATKFDKESFFAQFQKKLDNMGLKPLFPPNYSSKSGVVDTDRRQKPKPSQKLKDFFKQFAKEKSAAMQQAGKAGQGKPQGKGGKPEDQGGTAPEDELDLSAIGEGDSMEDHLRSLYMQLCIKLDVKNQIKLRLDLFRLKRKSGFDDAKLAAIQKEAGAVAVFKLTDLLREAFEERASLMELKGPEYELVRAKFKMALKGLKALNAKPEKKEMDKLRDHVNRSIFTVIKEDYLKVELYLESDPPNKSAIKVTRDRYLAMLNRLKAESNIMEEIRPKLFQDIALKSDTHIVDVA